MVHVFAAAVQAGLFMGQSRGNGIYQRPKATYNKAPHMAQE
jgi:hypothetical protein